MYVRMYICVRDRILDLDAALIHSLLIPAANTSLWEGEEGEEEEGFNSLIAPSIYAARKDAAARAE